MFQLDHNRGDSSTLQKDRQIRHFGLDGRFCEKSLSGGDETWEGVQVGESSSSE